MNSHKNNNLLLLHYISNIIRSDFDKVSFSEIDWELFTTVSSAHLLLPLMYERLKKKKNKVNVPFQLINYLKEISIINQDRNNLIISQILFISNLFNKNNIDYVFVKGVALLILKPYDVIKERMIGDIDILINRRQINYANNILKENGFINNSKEIYFSENIHKHDHRHLRRLVHPNFIAAVELHTELLKNKYIDKLRVKDVLSSKIKIENCYIPSKESLWKHSILSWQINDNGFLKNNISFRTIYDVLKLQPSNFEIILNNNSEELNHFYSLMSIFYPEYEQYKSFAKKLFLFKSKNRFFGNLYSFFIDLKLLIKLFVNRFFLLLKSSEYRSRLIKNPLILISKIIKLFKKIFFTFAIIFIL